MVNLNGWALQSEIKNTFGSIIPFFMQGITTFAYYKSNGRYGDFACRTKIGLTSNKVGEFGPFTLDSYLNLRGAGTQVDRGTGQFVLNLEHRYSFITTKKICIQSVVFTDLGTWRKPDEALKEMLKKKSIMGFSGIGSRVYFTKVYNLILRLDYGISLADRNRRGFVFGIGQYF